MTLILYAADFYIHFTDISHDLFEVRLIIESLK